MQFITYLMIHVCTHHHVCLITVQGLYHKYMTGLVIIARSHRYDMITGTHGGRMRLQISDFDVEIL